MCFKCKKKGHYSNECTKESTATSETKGTNLQINKEDISDDEVQSDDEEVNDDLQKNSTDHDSEKEDDDSSYKEDAMFSDEAYKGFAFVQDVHDVNCNMNNKARIPESWILLNSQSTVDMFMNKKLLKNVMMQKCLFLSTVTQGWPL